MNAAFLGPAQFPYGDLLARNALQYGDAPALAGSFGEVTHARLYQRAQGLAGALAAAGVVPGDRVALLASNCPQVFELLGACALRGATLLLLNTRASAAEIAGLVVDARPRLLFADAEFASALEQVPGDVPAYAFGPATERLRAWEALPQAHLDGSAVAQVDASSALVAIPTAAVEGSPRMALLSHAALMHQSLQLAHAWSLGAEARHLCILPLFHTAGLGLSLAAQLVGGASVLLPRFDAADAVAAIDRFGANFFASFAPILGSLLDAAKAAGSALVSLRHVTGLEPPESIARLQSHCPQAVFWSAYGQTETGGMVSLAPYAQRPGAAGIPLAATHVRIAGARGPGEAGEILVRGACVFSGYWNLPAESAHAARDGWHHTGDLGCFDEDGYLWFTGRAPDKTLIKSGGENIYPAEVEQALLAHPAVQSAVVFGVLDARWGEVPRAVCVLRAGHAVSGAALADFVGLRIARFKRPREVVFVPALPLLADGGWDRAAIQADYGGA